MKIALVIAAGRRVETICQILRNRGDPAGQVARQKEDRHHDQRSPATTSQAITLSPSLKADPFNPTSCSVERLVNSSDPAITPAPRLRPAKK